MALLAALTRFFLLFEGFWLVVGLGLSDVNFRDEACFHGVH